MKDKKGSYTKKANPLASWLNIFNRGKTSDLPRFIV